MPRYDAHHESVKRALEKDGWTITADPFIIGLGQTRMYADLGAEKDIRLIVVEIKTFVGDSFINELHRATGQYANYRSLIRRTADQYELFLLCHSIFIRNISDKITCRSSWMIYRSNYWSLIPNRR